MICKGIRVENFRNIASADVTFDEGVNILYGQNAQGKTNLLEAVSLVSVGRSFRGAKDAEMIRFGESMATVSVDYRRHGKEREENITIRMFDGHKRVTEQNKVKISRMSEMIGQYRTVLFCPEHLSLVKEGPALRRNFLDVAISQIRPVYLRALQRYGQILKERNRLIKDAQNDRRTFNETIDFWSAQLAAEAAVIAGFRQEYIGRLEKKADVYFKEMTTGRENPTFLYVQSGFDGEKVCDIAERRDIYYRLLSEHHDREISAGFTLYGIHRDDMEMLINEKSARIFASQGQQRSLSLALKLSEGEICREESGEYPVFLFDDVFSELDSERRAYLCEKIDGKQMIMTSCEPNLVRGACKIRVENGTFQNE